MSPTGPLLEAIPATVGMQCTCRPLKALVAKVAMDGTN